MVGTLTLGLAAPAVADDAPSLHLQPAGVVSTAAPGLRMGPFTIANFTGAPYRMQVLPVLLGQRRDGGLFVRQDPASLVAARGVLGADAGAFDLPPGAARSVLGLVRRRVSRARGIYGGILFRATPRQRTGQVVQVLQLDARVLLAPARPRARFAVAGTPRAEQAGRRRLRVLVAVVNRGNVLAHAGGRAAVRDGSGRVVARVGLRGLDVLPGAVVDLTGRLDRPLLAPGRYTLSAVVRVPGRDLRVAAPLDLFGVNQVRTEAARLVAFPAPRAYRGDVVVVTARFRNTGNVAYAPPAQVELRRLVGGRPGPLLAAGRMRAGERPRPGGTGELRGKVRVPDGPGSYEVRVALVQPGRDVDDRTVAVTALPRPSLLARLQDWTARHAFSIVLVLLGAVALAGALGIRYVRRLKAAARR